MNCIDKLDDYQNEICPDLRIYWQLGTTKDSHKFVLKAKDGSACFRFNYVEGYALQHFNGQWNIGQIQQRCQQKLGKTISPNFVESLLQKLINLGILADTEAEDRESVTPILFEAALSEIAPTPLKEGTEIYERANPSRNAVTSNFTPTSTASKQGGSSPTQSRTSPCLKACVQWIHHPEGYWILRNPEDVTYLQVDDRAKAAISQLGQLPPAEIARQHNLTPEQLRYLLQLLTATAMLEGTKPPKPPRKKFTPMQLLFFKLSLFNPDRYLEKPARWLGWMWTTPFFLALCFFLACSTVGGLNWRSPLFATGQILLQTQGAALMLPFGLLAMLVVTIHELGHALTLKHYGGIVPEIGLLFMFLMPAAYTNTSDAYCLVKRRQRVFVVAVGVLTQLVIGAIALWLWHLSVESSWLHPTSYLLLVASLFTVALNLNPLAKFDGYYLAVALTGINNLRSRSFELYANLLKGNPIEERKSDRLVLAAYAPFSLLYILFVFGSLFSFVTHWTLANIPMTAFVLLLVWAIYYIFPRPR